MKHSYLKKITAALFLVLAMPFSAQAQTDDGMTLKICTADGCEVNLPLDSIRKLTFDDTSFMLFFVSEEVNYCFMYDAVVKMTFENVATGIGEQIADEAGGIDIAYDGTYLRVTGCEGTSQLMVYDVSGRPVISRLVNDGAVISTANLGAGVYILKVNNKTFKFSRR